MAGLTALELRIFCRLFVMAPGTRVVAVKPVHGKEIAHLGTIGYVRLVVAGDTLDVHLTIFRHIVVTGSTPQFLVNLMRKDWMHQSALSILNCFGSFNDLSNLIQRSRFRSHGRCCNQATSDQCTQKYIFHIQPSFRTIVKAMEF